MDEQIGAKQVAKCDSNHFEGQEKVSTGGVSFEVACFVIGMDVDEQADRQTDRQADGRRKRDNVVSPMGDLLDLRVSATIE